MDIMKLLRYWRRGNAWAESEPFWQQRVQLVALKASRQHEVADVKAPHPRDDHCRYDLQLKRDADVRVRDVHHEKPHDRRERVQQHGYRGQQSEEHVTTLGVVGLVSDEPVRLGRQPQRPDQSKRVAKHVGRLQPGALQVPDLDDVDAVGDAEFPRHPSRVPRCIRGSR
ncbi:hypothetical protein PINS_up019206 [Pythium insidiosum]|nr:hypothetical protein PINS_up019206 [Pythium insidiosum]